MISASAGRSHSILQRHTISEAEATANNHERIMRLARRCSRAPRRPEMLLLRAAVARTFPLMPDVPNRNNLFCTMFPETLSRANLVEIDPNGFVMDKIEGIAANAWALYTVHYAPIIEKNPETSVTSVSFREEPPAYVGADSGGDDLLGRADTLMLVFRDGEILCVDNCPLIRLLMRTNEGRTGLDGELCVRRAALSGDEMITLGLATREEAPFGMSYLEPDDGNEASDQLYHLCYLAHDIMLADTRVQSLSTYPRKQPPIAASPYSKRLTEMTERLQPLPTTSKLLSEIAASVAAGGGSERAIVAEQAKAKLELECFCRRVCAQPQPYLSPILVMAKQPYRMAAVRYAFYAKMMRIRGVRTDGLIFIGESQPFQPLFIDADGAVINTGLHDGKPTALKKYKPRLSNSFDAKLVRNQLTRAYELYVSDRPQPVPSAGIWYGSNEEEIERTMALGNEVVAANMASADAQLFRPEARGYNDGRSVWHSVICECNPYVSPAAEDAIAAVPPPQSKDDEERYVLAVAAHIRWQPVLERVKKRRANTYANFCGVVKAIGLFPSRDDICTQIKNLMEAQRQETLDASKQIENASSASATTADGGLFAAPSMTTL
jgi:hypothetical protein